MAVLVPAAGVARCTTVFCFVLSASLLGTGWQLLNAPFYVVCFMNAQFNKLSEWRKGSKSKAKDIAFWDIAAGDADSIKNSMKNVRRCCATSPQMA